MYALATAKKEAYTALKKALGKSTAVSLDQLEIPPKPELGDLSFPCFEIAKGFKKNPVELAAELAAKIGPSKYIKEVVAAGPYVNFKFDNLVFAEQVLQDILKGKSRYGKSTTGKGKKILVEYANLNTHKEIHIGHVRNVALGQSIVNILRLNGYEVTPVSYINDLGNNVARCLWGLIYLHPNEEPPAEGRLNFLGKVYSEATVAIGDDEGKKAQVSEIQRQLESQSGEYLKLWSKTHKWSMDGLKASFAQFGLELDKIYLEHELIEDTGLIVRKLLTDGLAKVSQGAVIVDLEDQGLGVNLLRKSDGTFLYNAKDLALAYKKEADYDANRLVIVVDERQSLAMRQLIATLELMGFPGEVHHLSYDMVTLPEGAMSSRKGNIVSWDDLCAKMVHKLTEETVKRHPDWSSRKVKTNAQSLAIASAKFMMLRQDPDKVLVFDMEEALAADGYSAIYLLYTVARINTLLDKADITPDLKVKHLTAPGELHLIKLLSRFPDTALQACVDYRASLISQYAFELSQSFASYYESVRILDDQDLERVASRLALLMAVRQTLTNALAILGIKVVKDM